MLLKNKREEELARRIAALEKSIKEHIDRVRQIEASCVEIETNIHALAQKTKSEVVQINKDLEKLAESYFKILDQKDKTADAFKQISEKMTGLTAVKEKRKINIMPFIREFSYRFYTFVYRHQLLLVAMGCCAIAAVGLAMLITHNF